MKGKIKEVSDNAADKTLTKKALLYLEGLVIDMFNLKADKVNKIYNKIFKELYISCCAIHEIIDFMILS